MRNIITLASMLGITTSLFAQPPGYVPTDGLVGWWPFNGNANDESGNGNTGVPYGAALEQDRFGSANAAYTFDDVDDRINVAANLIAAPTIAGYSISLWFKSQQTTAGILISDRADGDWAYKYTVALRGDLAGAGRFGSHDGGSLINDLPSAQAGLNNNAWTHLVVVLDTLMSEQRLYINGQLDTVTTIASTGAWNPSTTGTVFGNWLSPGGWYDVPYAGLLDDIGFWNRVLTPGEILSLFQGENPPSIPDWLPSECLVAWYPFDGDAHDASGNGHHGLVNGPSLTSGHSGIPESAYAFDGTGANIDIGNDPSLGRASTSFSLVAWIRLDALADQRSCIISDRDGDMAIPGSCIGIAGMTDPGAGFDAGEVNISTADPIQFCSDQAITIGDWTFVALTYDHEASTVRIYYDGVLVSQGPMDYFLENPSVHHTIGYSANENGGIYPFNGVIDDLALYNCALTDSLISSIYVGSSTNIPEMLPAIRAVVAPNPNHGQFTVELELSGLASLQVFDARGRQVHNEVFQANGSKTQRTLDLSGLAKGGYTVQVWNAGAVVTQQVIVE